MCAWHQLQKLQASILCWTHLLWPSSFSIRVGCGLNTSSISLAPPSITESPPPFSAALSMSKPLSSLVLVRLMLGPASWGTNTSYTNTQYTTCDWRTYCNHYATTHAIHLIHTHLLLYTRTYLITVDRRIATVRGVSVVLSSATVFHCVPLATL